LHKANGRRDADGDHSRTSASSARGQIRRKGDAAEDEDHDGVVNAVDAA
jgi:hypothetical protein